MRSRAWTAAIVVITACGLSGCNGGLGGMFAENRPKLPSLGWGKDEEPAVAAAQPQYQPPATTAAGVPAVAMNPNNGQNYPSTGAAAYAQPAATSYPNTSTSYPTTAGGYPSTSAAAPAYGAGGYGQAAPYGGYAGSTATTTPPSSQYYNPSYPGTSATTQSQTVGSSSYEARQPT